MISHFTFILIHCFVEKKYGYYMAKLRGFLHGLVPSVSVKNMQMF